MRLLLLLALAFATSGCEVIEQPSGLIPEWTSAWRRIATSEDEGRLREWRKSFENALKAARNSGHAAEIARDGALLDPDAALANAAIPNGMYRCRVIKLGAKSEGMLDYVSYPGFTCRVRAERDLQRLNKLSGSQRYVGLVFPHDAMRKVFLGSLVLGDERRAMQYGQDETRNVVAFVERIGPARWRMLMPEPRFESQLDVMELVPADPGAQ